MIEADRYVKSQTNDLDDLDGDTQDFQIHRAFIGLELVPGTRRLALMNCLLHDIEGNLDHGGAIRLGNTLGSDGENLPKAHIVATNLPFAAPQAPTLPVPCSPDQQQTIVLYAAYYRNTAPRRSCGGGGAG